MEIRSHQEIYLDIYRKAKQKAKEIRKNAISAFLEAKNIKDKYNLKDLIDEVIKKYPQKVKEYQSGKKGLIGLFVGEVMKLSKGKADPKLTNELIRKKLD